MKDPRYRTKRWRQLRAQVITRDGGRCAVLHCKTDMSLPRMTQVDHIVEAEDGGDFWDPLNCQVLCFDHHRAKTLGVSAHRGGFSGSRFLLGGWDQEFGDRLTYTVHLFATHTRTTKKSL